MKFRRRDLYSPVSAYTRFELVISNPPYIKTADRSGLQREVREWEPLSAFDGGADGADYYRVIIPGARKFLADNGILALEIAPDVASAAFDIASGSGFIDVKVMKDYSGLERILTARWTR